MKKDTQQDGQQLLADRTTQPRQAEINYAADHDAGERSSCADRAGAGEQEKYCGSHETSILLSDLQDLKDKPLMDSHP